MIFFKEISYYCRAFVLGFVVKCMHNVRFEEVLVFVIKTKKQVRKIGTKAENLGLSRKNLDLNL